MKYQSHKSRRNLARGQSNTWRRMNPSLLEPELLAAFPPVVVIVFQESVEERSLQFRRTLVVEWKIVPLNAEVEELVFVRCFHTAKHVSSEVEEDTSL